MSKSFRHTPITSVCGNSNKPFKRYENRRARRKTKHLIIQGADIYPIKHDYGNEWDSPRDGKMYCGKSRNDYSMTYAKYGDSSLERDKTPHEDYLILMRK